MYEGIDSSSGYGASQGGYGGLGIGNPGSYGGSNSPDASSASTSLHNGSGHTDKSSHSSSNANSGGTEQGASEGGFEGLGIGNPGSYCSVSDLFSGTPMTTSPDEYNKSEIKEEEAIEAGTRCIPSHTPMTPQASEGFIEGLKDLSDVFVGVEVDLVAITGIEFGAGIVIDTDNLANSGIYGTIGPATGLNVGIGVGGGILKEINGWSYNIDANIGVVSPTISGDKNGFNGVGLSCGKGAGLSASATLTETYTVSEMLDDISGLYNDAKDFFTSK